MDLPQIASISALFVSFLGSFLLVHKAEPKSLNLPQYLSIGKTVWLKLLSTYGIGLVLWNLSPSTSLGTSTHSSIGAISRLTYLASISTLSISFGYYLASRATPSSPKHIDLRSAISLNFKPLCLLVSFTLIATLISLSELLFTGFFDRQLAQQLNPSTTSSISILVTSSGILSRIFPVTLMLIPFIYNELHVNNRNLVLFSLILILPLLWATQTRTLIIAVPFFLLVGTFISGRLKLKKLILTLVISSFIFLPIAEYIRVNRYSGNPLNLQGPLPSIELHQLARQVLGVPHEVYAMVSSEDCQKDLKIRLEQKPFDIRLLTREPDLINALGYERWDIIRSYYYCSGTQRPRRYFSGFSSLAYIYLPKTLFPRLPSLHDGQQLSQQLSNNLNLKEAETSHSTIGIFVDLYWRFGLQWTILVLLAIGALVRTVDYCFYLHLSRQSILFILIYLSTLSLLLYWINNTVLTAIWHLAWDLPKSFILICCLFGVARLATKKTSKP